ncbi:MAG: glycosyltransferase family 9 protein [Candidatus Babeliales bacterium]|jgi:lipopolysaccharide heptosyltransferase I
MRILIVRVSAIGDVIHTLPALFLIKQSIPHAHISWVVQEKAAALLVGQPFLDNVWVLPDHYLAPRNWLTTMRIIRSMHTHTWDAIIDFQGLFKTSFLLAWLHGKKFGFDRHHARDRFSTWFTHHHTTPLYRNIIQKNLALASDVLVTENAPSTCPTIDTLAKDFTLHVPMPQQHIVDTWLQENSITHPILMFPNTTWPSKHWPLQRWQKLFTLITQDATLSKHTFILGGSSMGGQAQDLSSIIQRHNLSIRLLPPWDLLSLAHVIKKARLVIAPDTGILHLADFLGTPSLGIFGPTKIQKHGPFLVESNQHNAIQVDCPHHACKRHAHQKGASVVYDCMEQLEAATVFHALIKILGI